MLAEPLRRRLAIARQKTAVIHRIDVWFIGAFIIALSALSTVSPVSALSARSATAVTLAAEGRAEHVRLPQTPLVAPALGRVAPDVDDVVDWDLWDRAASSGGRRR